MKCVPIRIYIIIIAQHMHMTYVNKKKRLPIQFNRSRVDVVRFYY